MITTTQVESEIAQNLNMYKRADNRGKAQLVARNKELRTVLDYLKSGVNEDQLRLQLNKVETLIDRYIKRSKTYDTTSIANCTRRKNE